jgi:hypothetical protein
MFRMTKSKTYRSENQACEGATVGRIGTEDTMLAANMGVH